MNTLNQRCIRCIQQYLYQLEILNLKETLNKTNLQTATIYSPTQYFATQDNSMNLFCKTKLFKSGVLQLFRRTRFSLCKQNVRRPP